MTLIQEIENMSDAELRDLNRTLGKKVAKRLLKQIAWRTTLVIGTHIVAKRIAKKLASEPQS